MLDADAKSTLHRYENDLLVAEHELGKLSARGKALEADERRLNQEAGRIKHELDALRKQQATLEHERLSMESDIQLLKHKMKAIE